MFELLVAEEITRCTFVMYSDRVTIRSTVCPIECFSFESDVYSYRMTTRNRVRDFSFVGPI